MTYAPLPAPAITDPPNVPSDLGKVAIGIEGQALAQYAGYNSANSPSAASVETRLTAVDDPSTGTAQALDTRIAALNASITTWTSGPTSTLTAQAARTTAYPARQDSQDATMTSLTGSLATYEPQVTQLQQQRPGGMVVRHAASYQIAVGEVGSLVDSVTFTVSQPARFYRIIFSGSFLNQCPIDHNPSFGAFFTLHAGATPSLSGTVIGAMRKFTPVTGYMPFSVMGLTTGNSAGQYTIGLYASVLAHSGSSFGTVALQCPTLLEDLGYKYF